MTTKTDITTQAGRRRLISRREPYWHRVGDAYLGFRAGDEDGTWIGRIRINEKQQYQAFGRLSDFKEATRALQTWLSELESARVGGVSKEARDLTVADACAHYLAESLKLRGNTRSHQHHVNLIELVVVGREQAKRRPAVVPAEIAAVKLKELTKIDVRAWRDALLDVPEVEAPRTDRATASRRFKMLIAVLNKAHADGLVSTNGAWDGVTGFGDTQARSAESHRYLTRQERQALIESMESQELRDFVELLARTGARPVEAQRLLAGDFDKRSNTLRLWSLKGAKRVRRERVIPVDALPGVLPIVKRLIKDRLPGTPLFNQSTEFWVAPVAKAVVRAELGVGVSAYCLRHSFITDAIVAGVDLHTAAAVTGTSIAQIEKTYAKLLTDHVRASFARMTSL